MSEPGLEVVPETKPDEKGNNAMPTMLDPRYRCECSVDNVKMCKATMELRQQASDIHNSFQRPAMWILFFAWTLAMCAGLVNVAAFRRWDYFVSHVSGMTTAIGLHAEGFQQGRHNFFSVGANAGLLLSFLAGAFACGMLIDKNHVHFGGKSLYGVALVGNAVLLLGAMMSGTGLSGAYLAAAACGLQNAMCTSHFGAIVRTTHVTGTVTDIGSTCGRMTMIFLRKGCKPTRLTIVETAEFLVDARKLMVLLPMWSSFVAGSFLGAHLESEMGNAVLIIPTCMTGSMGVLYMYLRYTMTISIEDEAKAKNYFPFRLSKIAWCEDICPKRRGQQAANVEEEKLETNELANPVEKDADRSNPKLVQTFQPGCAITPKLGCATPERRVARCNSAHF